MGCCLAFYFIFFLLFWYGCHAVYIPGITDCAVLVQKCETHSACGKLWAHYRRHCPTKHQKCFMASKQSCYEAFEYLRKTPLPKCKCHDDPLHRGFECHKLYIEINHNHCIEELFNLRHPLAVHTFPHDPDNFQDKTLWSVKPNFTQTDIKDVSGQGSYHAANVNNQENANSVVPRPTPIDELSNNVFTQYPLDHRNTDQRQHQHHNIIHDRERVNNGHVNAGVTRTTPTSSTRDQTRYQPDQYDRYRTTTQQTYTPYWITTTFRSWENFRPTTPLTTPTQPVYRSNNGQGVNNRQRSFTTTTTPNPAFTPNPVGYVEEEVEKAASNNNIEGVYVKSMKEKPTWQPASAESPDPNSIGIQVWATVTTHTGQKSKKGPATILRPHTITPMPPKRNKFTHTGDDRVKDSRHVEHTMNTQRETKTSEVTFENTAERATNVRNFYATPVPGSTGRSSVSKTTSREPLRTVKQEVFDVTPVETRTHHTQENMMVKENSVESYGRMTSGVDNSKHDQYNTLNENAKSIASTTARMVTGDHKTSGTSETELSMPRNENEIQSKSPTSTPLTTREPLFDPEEPIEQVVVRKNTAEVEEPPMKQVIVQKNTAIVEEPPMKQVIVQKNTAVSSFGQKPNSMVPSEGKMTQEKKPKPTVRSPKSPWVEDETNNQMQPLTSGQNYMAGKDAMKKLKKGQCSVKIGGPPLSFVIIEGKEIKKVKNGSNHLTCTCIDAKASCVENALDEKKKPENCTYRDIQRAHGWFYISADQGYCTCDDGSVVCEYPKRWQSLNTTAVYLLASYSDKPYSRAVRDLNGKREVKDIPGFLEAVTRDLNSLLYNRTDNPNCKIKLSNEADQAEGSAVFVLVAKGEDGTVETDPVPQECHLAAKHMGREINARLLDDKVFTVSLIKYFTTLDRTSAGLLSAVLYPRWIYLLCALVWSFILCTDA